MEQGYGFPPDDETRRRVPESSYRPGTWLGLTALGLITVLALVALVRSRNRLQEAEAGRFQTLAALAQAQNQIQALTSRIDALSAAERAREVVAAQTATPAPPPLPEHSVRPARRDSEEDGDAEERAVMDAMRHPSATRVVLSRGSEPDAPAHEDPRVSRVESQLAVQKQELAKTRDDLSRTRADLEGRIRSTREELQTSVARTHDELVNLQKRGERLYYEFDLDKSKDFQSVGPVSMALRKVNTRHDFYDMTLQVGDAKLEKKHVSLYEPVLITVYDRPMELVVNQMSKDHVKGYLSEPKYRKPELAATGDPAAQLQKR